MSPPTNYQRRSCIAYQRRINDELTERGELVDDGGDSWDIQGNLTIEITRVTSSDNERGSNPMEGCKMSDYGPRDRNLRAADADRDTVAETLREQHLAGRIDTDELQERIERCYAAKTYAELDALLADLPAADLPQDDRSARARHGWRGVPRFALLPVLPLLILALAFSHGRVLWLVFPLAFFLIVRPLRRYGISSGACRSNWPASVPHSSRS